MKLFGIALDLFQFKYCSRCEEKKLEGHRLCNGRNKGMSDTTTEPYFSAASPPT